MRSGETRLITFFAPVFGEHVTYPYTYAYTLSTPETKEEFLKG